MRVLKVEPCHGEAVTVEGGCDSGEYTRYSSDNWEYCVGESKEGLSFPEDVEAAYQTFMRDKPAATMPRDHVEPELGVSYPTHHDMYTEAIADSPTKPGWYLARMKYRGTYEGREFVKVSKQDGGLMAFQPGDSRSWRLDEFEWFARIYLKSLV
jgi:hypothetical protein